MPSLSRCICLTACRCDWATASMSPMHLPCRNIAGESAFWHHGHDVLHEMINFGFKSGFWIHPLSVLFFLFSFWVNPLSFYCCKHLANEPILRQWPLLPIKALKPAEDLLGQETREKERERQRSISGQQTRKNDWGDLVRPWCGLCTLRNIYSRLWSPRAHKPLHVSAMSVWPLNQALQRSPGSPEKLHC